MLAGVRADYREMLHEQIQYRDLMWQMTARELLLRYKQTVMGIGWALFMPLLNTAVFSFIFTRVAPIDTPVPYPLFAFCGLLVWNFFASSLRFSVNALTSNSLLVTKVYFPREVLPFSMVAVCAVDFAVGSVVLVLLMLFYGVSVTVAIVWLPVILAVLIAFTLGMSLLVAMANLFYRDVKYIFEIVMAVWMFAAPVVYPIERSGAGFLGAIVAANPMSAVVHSFRNVLLLGQPPSDGLWIAGAASFAMLLVGWLWFHRAEYRFAENI